MGMDMQGTIGIGAVIYTDEFRENASNISEEELEEKYDGYISEYFYTLLEPLDIIVGTCGYSDSENMVAMLHPTCTSADYDAVILDSVSNLSEENIRLLKEKLDSVNIKYKDIGVMIYATYG